MTEKQTAKEALELRLAIIERRQRLLFEAIKKLGYPNIAHHWKRTPGVCAQELTTD